MIEKIRNVAIIAHVDHGKTTLVDQLLRQSGAFDAYQQVIERVMDSNDLERERGITILAKNTAINWNGYHINIVDTPGHADFGGEVERVLSMVDSVLLLVDAVEGPMPQTRFVTQKALARGFKPIVVINKIDRPGCRIDWVLNKTFDLFDQLDASEEQLDFPVVYASALQGYATRDPKQNATDMQALFNAIVDYVPPPEVDRNGAMQIQVSSLDYDRYIGLMGIGRITRGQVRRNTPVRIVHRDGQQRSGRMLQLFTFIGLRRIEIEQANAGDIIAFSGVDDLQISDTLCDPERVEALPALSVDEPTVTMNFQVNKSPFAGRDGTFVTSRQIGERLQKELKYNVALRVETTDDPDTFKVSGRGELHLSILIENMRREGYELGVSRPQVIYKTIDGVRQEPFEQLTVDIEQAHQGPVMECLGSRAGDLKDMAPDHRGRVVLQYIIPSRGLIGLRTEFLSMTQGSGLMYSCFDHYGPARRTGLGQRNNGVLISNGAGKVLAFALFNLQERGRLLVVPGDEVYEGMVVGIHSRSNDLVVNPLRAKQLTNIRAAGSDENIILTPALRFTLEQALEFIDDDELVEVTPAAIRIRKRALKEHERKKAARLAVGI